MARDASGNDVEKVAIPLTGFLAFSEEETQIPADQGGPSFETLPQGFKKIGLIKQDGGFEWSMEPEGDPIEFWQDGYQIPTGLATVELTFSAAEYSDITRALQTGKQPDANGYLTVAGGGSAKTYTWMSEEIFRNGAIRRRVFYGPVVSAQLDKSERGVVNGIEFKVSIQPHRFVSYDHFGEWVVETNL